MWHHILDGVDAVVHLAARAHVIRDAESDPDKAFLETNYEGTKTLAEACRNRVSRFLYVSTVGVHGADSGNRSLNESSNLKPYSPYTRSKALAESDLLSLAQQGDLDCRILRPPLVYGPGMPGNLSRLLRLINKGIPLPLGSVRNRRNLIGIGHLSRAIRALLEVEYVRRRVYLVADREVVSTPEIIRNLAEGVCRPARLLAFPVAGLKVLGASMGQRHVINQLVGNLEIDTGAFRNDFGNIQPCSTRDGLIAAAQNSRP